jgi:2-aminoadipate transaminase
MVGSLLREVLEAIHDPRPGSCLAGWSCVRSIDSLQRACAARTDVIALAGGLPDPALFPREAMRRAMATVMAEPKLGALQYGWPEGDEKLRGWIARRVGARADEVIVTAGAQQAIALATSTIPRAGTIGVAPATYAAALELFATQGLTSSSEAAASVDAFYLVPEIGNPEGLPLDEALAEIVRTASVPVIVDDAYAELRFDGARTHVGDRFSSAWRIGTFAKTLCPGLRVGWLVPPSEHRALVLRLKHDADLHASGLGQAVLAELLRTWDYDAHLARARKVYARRADALARALRTHLPSWTFREPEGGFSFFVDTSFRGNDVAFLAVASAHGVSFDPGRMFRAEPRERIELRLCHCNVDAPLLEEGVKRLARAWRDFTSDSCEARRSDPRPA